MKRDYVLLSVSAVMSTFVLWDCEAFALNLNAPAKAPFVQASQKPDMESSEPASDAAESRDPFRTALPIKFEVPVERPKTKGSEPVKPIVPEDEYDYSSLSVTGIVWGALEPKAIINDQIFGVGSDVNGAKIISITKEGILFEYKGKEFLMKRNMFIQDTKGSAAKPSSFQRPSGKSGLQNVSGGQMMPFGGMKKL